MAFTGLASNELFTASAIQRSIAEMIVGPLSAKETPILDWLGDSNRFATNIKHEFIEDQMLPNTIVTSTAIASATGAVGIQLATAGLGNAFNVGQLIRNRSANPEVMQITSIPSGGNSLVFSRAYDAGTTGSLAAGGTLYVGGAAGVEGADHSGADTRRLSVQRANTVGLFRMELAQSNTQFGLNQIGNDAWEARKSKSMADVLRQLENEAVFGVVNGANSLATSSTTRTMQGIQSQLTSINSTVAATSFAANPHLYVGNVWQAAYDNGASDTESWAIVAGSTFYKNLSDLNDSKVQDSNTTELFKRKVRTYEGPFGTAALFPSRVLPATELLLVAKERLHVIPFNGRSFVYEDMAKTGDNRKGLITGEYTLELYHEAGMARLRV